MNIYTKSGDKGETSLFDGSRVLKCHKRIKLLGQIDDLNSFIGLLISKVSDKYHSELQLIQEALFVAGSEIANPKCASFVDFSRLTNQLESKIDEYNASLEELHNFILPGGHDSAAICHICRTKTRTTERVFVNFFINKKHFNKTFGVLLNRLSDYFFVLARRLNADHGVGDIIWSHSSSVFH